MHLALSATGQHFGPAGDYSAFIDVYLWVNARLYTRLSSCPAGDVRWQGIDSGTCRTKCSGLDVALQPFADMAERDVLTLEFCEISLLGAAAFARRFALKGAPGD